MKDEIKQILDELDWYIKQPNNQDINGEYEPPMELSQEEAKEIYDCITNLQEELKSANESITWYSNRFKAVERDNRKLKEENKELKENNKKKTSRCTERNHRIRGCQRVIERRNKKISKLEQQLDKYKNVIDKIKEKVDYYKSAKYGTYDSDDILADLNYIFLELLEEVE